MSMRARVLTPKRICTLLLLAAAVGVAIWWVGYVPYDPQAIYRPLPANATLVGRHLRLPERWPDVLANPLAQALMRTAGVAPEDAADLVADEKSFRWFEMLAGREGTLAYLPSPHGGDDAAWIAVSHLGGHSQKLRWQLTLFRVPGFTRMATFPGHAAWRVDTPDLDPRQTLTIAFGEGIIMACLSPDPYAIEAMLAAYDGRSQRLLEREPAFAQFAAQDDRAMPDRFWIRDRSPLADPVAPGITLEVPRLEAHGLTLVAATAGLAVLPEDRPPTTALTALARRVGQAPCLGAAVSREALLHVATQMDLPRTERHVLRMILDVMTADRLILVGMDGEMGGRLAWGMIRSLGLAGLRVPTLLLATPAPDTAAAHAAIQRVLDASNARYRAAFILNPVASPAGTFHVLASAGGNEWVDELAPADRPAYMVLDGWLLAASNLAALQKMAEQMPANAAPPWATALAAGGALTAWVDLARSGKVARDAIATWSMVQMFMSGGNTHDIRAQLNDARAWIDAFAPLASARLELGRRQNQTTLTLDLGLSPAEATE